MTRFSKRGYGEDFTETQLRQNATTLAIAAKSKTPPPLSIDLFEDPADAEGGLDGIRNAAKKAASRYEAYKKKRLIATTERAKAEPTSHPSEEFAKQKYLADLNYLSGIA